MKNSNKIIQIIVFLVLFYSIYSHINTPVLMEGFTNGIRSTFRPSIRIFRLYIDNTTKNINSITKNIKMKFGL